MSTSKPLVVVGDSMLDVDILGSATRLSPEAPVPVVDAERHVQRPGGAGLAALLAARTEAPVVLITGIADDDAGRALHDLLSCSGVRVLALPVSGTTVCKIRIRARGQSVLRLDRGDATPVDGPRRPTTALPAVRAALTESARRVPVVWDPHPRGAPPVPGCALVTPNHEEARGFCHDDGSGDGGEALLRTWAADAVCITRGSRSRSGPRPPPAMYRFAVAAAVALAAGNDAVGSDPLTSRSRPAGGCAGRASTMGATGGCFDLLHTGHIRLLRQARELGDALIVLVNSDASVRALKGSGRPVMRDADRARVLAALACVDAVAVFDGLTPERMLEDLRPDIWVKGGDYVAAELPEADVVYRHGGEVVILPTVAGYSSSRLIAAAATGRPE